MFAGCCRWSGRRWPPRQIADSIDGVAYTAGPGLIGALLVGAGFAASLGFAWGRPVLGIHHLEGHLLAPLLEPKPPAFPFLALLVSGGHTQLVDVAALGRYRILGETLDDAAGEAFDKTAKLLGLPYPGGAALAALGRERPRRPLRFPAPHARSPRTRFQFQWLEDRRPSSLAGPCFGRRDPSGRRARFPGSSGRDPRRKFAGALLATGHRRLVVAGGVGANRRLRERLAEVAHDAGAELFFPRASSARTMGP